MSKEEKLVVVVCVDKSLHGKKINMPIIGEVSIEEDGTVEVPEKLAKLLVNDDSPWNYKDLKKEKKIIVDDVDDTEDEEEEEDDDTDGEGSEDDIEKGEEDDEDLNLKTIKENLEKMTLKELVEMAENAEYDVKEYKSFKTNKKLMIAFLTKKATEEN